MSGKDGEKRSYQYEVVSEDERLGKASTIDQHMKRKIRRLRVIQRILNLIVSTVVLGIMVNAYVTFANNRTFQSGGQTIAIYPVNPITWPTYMMIATGAVSILFNASIMIAYCWGVGSANKVSQWGSYWNYLMHVVNIGVWIATSTTFQMVKGAADEVPPARDIWGWTCSNATDALSAEFQNLPVNFNLQCQSQQVSFDMGIVNAGLEILSIAISLYALRRMIHKKRMSFMEQRLKNGVPTVQ